MKLSKKLLFIPAGLFFLWLILSLGTKDFIFINDTHVSGQSMEPALHDGEWIFLSSKKPEIGDIIAFDCLAEKCRNGETNKGRVKRIIDIDHYNCLYVLGDNREHSNDSADYGWLCPADIKIDGVVIQ